MKWYNDISQLFMSRDYLRPGQTINDKIDEISSYAGNILYKDMGTSFANKVKDYIEKGWYIISTPTWTNFNDNTKASPISCFGTYIEDSLESIQNANSEIGMQNKIGGGTSGYFGNLRSRGSTISGGGTSNGAVSFMEMFQTTAKVVAQANRRGHFSAYLPIEHGDFKEFIKSRTDGHIIQDLSFSVSITDDFMNKVLEQDPSAIERFRLLVEARFHTGFPYIFFHDTVNKNTVDVYKDNNSTIYHSNMCQPRSATILKKFDNGESKIVQLGDISIGDTIWSGHNWTKVINKWSTGVKDVYEYTTSTGYFLGTDNHRIVSKGTKVEVGKAKTIDWNVGDSTLLSKDFDLQTIVDGLVLGDGGIHKASNNLVLLYIGSKDQDYFDSNIKDFIGKDRSKLSKNSYEITTNIKSYELPHTYLREVPDRYFYSNEKTKRSFLRGLFSANGSVVGDRIVLTQSSYNLISQVQEMLSSLGIHSYITTLSSRDRTFSNGVYTTKPSYSINITSGRDIFKEYIGFIQEYKNVKIKPANKAKYLTSKIKSVEYHSTEEVFEITVEDDSHTYWTGGVLVSNCSEIALPNNTYESFVCNIMGMNLEYYDEWKGTDAVETAIYFMDAMMTDFINKNRDVPMMEKSVRFAERHRAMGLGASGYHTYLQSRGIAFESLEAKMLNNQIFSYISKEAYKASEKMAEEFGKPEILSSDKYNRRHTTLLAIAPNTSSSFIMGQQSQSIEPLISNFYTRDVAKTRINIKNKFLTELLEHKGINTSDIWESIGINNGSVQHLTQLNNDEKSIFKTFSEISQYEILLQASQRQRFIDQSQSLNLMIPYGTKVEDVAYLIIKAHQLGIKTLYYQLNVNAALEFTNSITECVSCSG